MSKDFGEAVRENYRKQGEKRAIERIIKQLENLHNEYQHLGSHIGVATIASALAVVKGSNK